MLAKNSITWVATIAGYGKCDSVVKSRKVFDEIPVPDASSWAAMMVYYARNWHAKEAIEHKKMKETNVKTEKQWGYLNVYIEMANTLAKHVEEGCCDKFV